MPSFTDLHLHLLRYGLMKMDLDLRRAGSWQKVKDLISSAREEGELEEHEWIIARGLMDNACDDIAGHAAAIPAWFIHFEICTILGTMLSDGLTGSFLSKVAQKKN